MSWTTQPRSTTMWTSGTYGMEAMTEIESASLVLKLRFKNKSLGVI
jgi:hypothetical protein